LILAEFRGTQKKIPSHTFTNEKGFLPGDSILAKIMTTKEVSEYLKLHEITICKYAAQGKIPAIRIGWVWRFDKDVIDRWIGGVQKQIHTNDNKGRGGGQRVPNKKRSKKRKG
jgi:excisionase family DNA binding protein